MAVACFNDLAGHVRGIARRHVENVPGLIGRSPLAHYVHSLLNVEPSTRAERSVISMGKPAHAVRLLRHESLLGKKEADPFSGRNGARNPRPPCLRCRTFRGTTGSS